MSDVDGIAVTMRTYANYTKSIVYCYIDLGPRWFKRKQRRTRMARKKRRGWA